MAVKPYWWCPECCATHDAQVAKCQRCGHAVYRKTMKVPSVEITPPPPWVEYIYPHNALVRPVRGLASPAVDDRADALRYATSGSSSLRETGPGIAAKIAPTTPQRSRLQTTCWAPYDIWDSLEDA